MIGKQRRGEGSGAGGFDELAAGSRRLGHQSCLLAGSSTRIMEFRQKPLTLPVKYSTSRRGTTVSPSPSTARSRSSPAAVRALERRSRAVRAPGRAVVILDVDDARGGPRTTITAGGGLGDARVRRRRRGRVAGAAIEATAAAHRRIDILVNNAGIAHVGTVERTDRSGLRSVVPGQRQRRLPVRTGRRADHGRAGRRRDPEHGVDHVADWRAGTLCLFDEQRRRA